MADRIQLDPEARITALRGQRDKAVSEHEDTLALLEIYKQAVEQLQARVAELEAADGEGPDGAAMAEDLAKYPLAMEDDARSDSAKRAAPRAKPKKR